ncbi:MAG: hypothetical protein RBT34_00460 [Anaerolineaceae bacterium]|jgi:hypothetical protein|nr:hypothetical protein [Anaerolineaceae bacterium]
MEFYRAGRKMILLLVVVLVLAGCAVGDTLYLDEEGWEEGGYPDTELVEDDSDCPIDMVYDAEWDECVDGDAFDDEGGFLTLLDDMWKDAPEDCYEDETYDAELEQCIYNGADVESFSLLDILGGVIDSFSLQDEGLGDGVVLVTYKISGETLLDPVYVEVGDDFIAAQKDLDSQQSAWAYFASLVPVEERAQIVEFQVFTDGEEETLAYVEPLADDLRTWRLSIDIADTKNVQELTLTMIHEYGHVLTLNAGQIAVGQSGCSTYQNQEGCALPQSYLAVFVDQFWGELYDEWQEIDYIQNDDAYYAALDDFYAKYADQFVSDYAATNPEEDIAEAWSHFVLYPRPDGKTIAEQKILFFYDYPELVTLREEIVARTVSRVRRSGK